MELLYKFAPPAGIEYLLRRATVRFASANRQNDINESSVMFGAVVRGIKEELYREYSTSKRGSLPQGVSLDEAMSSNWFNYISARNAWIIMNQYFGSLQFASFSRGVSNLLLWSHYAAGASGICVAFESCSTFLSDPSTTKLGVKSVAPVTYSQDKTEMPFDNVLDNMQHVLTRKSLEWAYEEEVRAFRYSESGTGFSDVFFDRDSVRHIFLGPRMTEENAVIAQEYARGYFRNAQLWLALPDPDRYMMAIIPAPESETELRLWLSEPEAETLTRFSMDRIRALRDAGRLSESNIQKIPWL